MYHSYCPVINFLLSVQVHHYNTAPLVIESRNVQDVHYHAYIQLFATGYEILRSLNGVVPRGIRNSTHFRLLIPRNIGTT